MRTCDSCGAPTTLWDPGEEFVCAHPDWCQVCDPGATKLIARRDRVLSSPHRNFLLRCRLLPFVHQTIGVEALVKNPYFFLTDEMGAGKTFQVIVAAQILISLKRISKVIVVAPASVRSVWFNQELGELQKHLWHDMPCIIREFHQKQKTWQWGDNTLPPEYEWVIANYEFIRAPHRLKELKRLAPLKCLIVLDESSAVKNHKAAQTVACLALRNGCERVFLLNGTPIANSPGDLYAQGRLLHPKILDCGSWLHFRAEYAVLGGFNGKSIVAWRHVDQMQKKFAPYVLRRLKKDCLDLPEKMPPTTRTFPLSQTTWRHYKAMRDEMVMWLTESTVSVASQAAVKAMRLAQITSGFVGGVEAADPAFELEFEDDSDRPSFIPKVHTQPASQNIVPIQQPLDLTGHVQAIGREKLDSFLEWYALLLEEDPKLKLLVWTRFRAELHRGFEEMVKLGAKNGTHVAVLHGGQKRHERDATLRLLDPRTSPDAPVIVIGTTATGSMGLNLTAAHTVAYLSNDFNLKTRLQSEDRTHRPGQRNIVTYTDFVATGPNGQKTIDHIVLKALRDKNDIARWTTSAWVKALTEE